MLATTKYLTTLLLTVAFVCLLFPPETFASQELDGYGWEIWPRDSKLIYLDGFIHGYDAKAAATAVYGYSEEIDLKRGGSRPFISRRNAHYYVKEVDAFYNKYPRCKPIKFNVLLSDMIEAWENKKKVKLATAYREIGKKCVR